MLPEVVIRTSATSGGGEEVEHAGMNQNQQSAHYQDGHAGTLYHLHDVLDVVIETQGTTLDPRGTAKSSTASLAAVGPDDRLGSHAASVALTYTAE